MKKEADDNNLQEAIAGIILSNRANRIGGEFGVIPDAEAEELEVGKVTKAGVFTAGDSRRRLGGTSDQHLLNTETPVASATDWLDGGEAPDLIVWSRLLFLHICIF